MLLNIAPHVAPQWSPYAVAVGVMIGFIFGAITAALCMLRLQRTERLAESERERNNVTIETIRATVGRISASKEPHSCTAIHRPSQIRATISGRIGSAYQAKEKALRLLLQKVRNV